MKSSRLSDGSRQSLIMTCIASRKTSADAKVKAGTWSYRFHHVAAHHPPRRTTSWTGAVNRRETEWGISHRRPVTALRSSGRVTNGGKRGQVSLRTDLSRVVGRLDGLIGGLFSSGLCLGSFPRDAVSSRQFQACMMIAENSSHVELSTALVAR